MPFVDVLRVDAGVIHHHDIRYKVDKLRIGAADCQDCRALVVTLDAIHIVQLEG